MRKSFGELSDGTSSQISLLLSSLNGTGKIKDNEIFTTREGATQTPSTNENETRPATNSDILYRLDSFQIINNVIVPSNLARRGSHD